MPNKSSIGPYECYVGGAAFSQHRYNRKDMLLQMALLDRGNPENASCVGSGGMNRTKGRQIVSQTTWHYLMKSFIDDNQHLELSQKSTGSQFSWHCRGVII